MEQKKTNGEAVRAPQLVKWSASADEYRLAMAIARKAVAAGFAGDRSVLQVTMDLLAVHLNGRPLDLPGLLTAPIDLDFAHDIGGIARHLDRDSGKLRDCFMPRYAISTFGSDDERDDFYTRR